jgi:hypothetical protein
MKLFDCVSLFFTLPRESDFIVVDLARLKLAT